MMAGLFIGLRAPARELDRGGGELSGFEGRRLLRVALELRIVVALGGGDMARLLSRTDGGREVCMRALRSARVMSSPLLASRGEGDGARTEPTSEAAMTLRFGVVVVRAMKDVVCGLRWRRSFLWSMRLLVLTIPSGVPRLR